MSSMRYFGKKKMELLYLEIKLSTQIQLKITRQWLINQECLKKRLESQN